VRPVAALPILVLVAIAAPAVAAPEEPPPPHYVSRGGEAMGTFIEVKLWARDDAGARAAMGDAFAEIARIERLMTTWRDDSDISRVNAAAGVAPVAVSPETRECVKRSLEFSRLSGGAFDVTFYALKGLWKFDQDLEKKLPDPKVLAERRKLIDWRQVVVDDKAGTLYLRKAGMRMNLGGIAKGYAVDRAVAVLQKAGFHDGIVQAGGDLMLFGSKSGKPFSAGIRDPRSVKDDYFAVAPVTDHAFSTAGDYERTFTLDGRRYHHIIDPKTGYPATRSRSVTVWAKDATTADGLDDAVFILGAKKGLALVESLPDVGAVIVDSHNKVWISKRLAGVVQIVRPPTDGP